MIVEERDGSVERLVLVSMIVNSLVLGRIAGKWTREGLFASEWANIVGKWCVWHYKKYGKAPRQMIEGLFNTWANKTRQKHLIEIVESFISSLEGEYKQLSKRGNAECMIDMAADHFNAISTINLSKRMKELTEAGKVSEAQREMNSYRPLDFGKGAWIDVLQDKSAIEHAFSVKRETLVPYPGDAGRFFDKSLGHDCLVAFQAVPGRGKSFLLQDVCFRGVLEQRNVAMFQIGDMSEDQIMRRLMVRIAQKPAKQRKVRWPTSLTVDQDGEPQVEFEEQEFEHPLDWEEAWEACQRLIKSTIRSDESNFKLSVYPNFSINAYKIKEEIEVLERSGWRPHIVAVDYCDLLTSPPGIRDQLEAIDANWKILKGISQEFHCLVVTVTQSGASAAKAKTQGMQHFSGRWTKLAHCTDFYALDQTKEEKELQLIRLTSLKGRERDDVYYTPDNIYFAQCLALANGCVQSAFPFWSVKS